MKYRRILLKLSGEAMMGRGSFGVDKDFCLSICQRVKACVEAGMEVAIVVGGGNIFRGEDAMRLGVQRVPADYVGMLATVINGVILQQSFEAMEVPAILFSALPVEHLAKKYDWKSALFHMNKSRVVIFSGGTGNPYCTTDTAAALKAVEMKAEVLLKATKVAGIYDKDPKKFNHAKRYSQLSYRDVLEKNLSVMDMTAITLCKENDLPIIVFDLFSGESFLEIIENEGIKSTLVRS